MEQAIESLIEHLSRDRVGHTQYMVLCSEGQANSGDTEQQLAPMCLPSKTMMHHPPEYTEACSPCATSKPPPLTGGILLRSDTCSSHDSISSRCPARRIHIRIPKHHFLLRTAFALFRFIRGVA